MDTDFTKDDVTNFLNARISACKQVAQQNNLTPKTCRDWVLSKLTGNIHYRINSAMTEIEYCASDKKKYIQSDIDSLNNRLVEYNADEGKPYDVGTIKSVLQNIQQDALSHYHENVIDSIEYDSTKVPFVEEFLQGLYDYLKPQEDYITFSVLMKHWSWLVKRKLNGYGVRNHIWLNFYGGTGLGKTTMIKKLCAPMEDFVSTTNISKLFDDTKEIKRLTEKYVLNFDELAVNADAAGDGMLASDQLATLKSMLTGDYLDARVYGTQNQARKKITFTCISSANYHLYDIIFDEQSMRRFFEFHCEAKKPDSYAKINSILAKAADYWKGINENDDFGYWVETRTDLWKSIEAIQTNYYPTKTTVSQWTFYNKLISGDNTPKQLYPLYKTWCDENGFKSKKTLPGFVDELKRRFPQFICKDGILRMSIETEKNETVEKFKNIVNFKNKKLDDIIGKDDNGANNFLRDKYLSNDVDNLCN